MKTFYVEVVAREGDEVVERLGPASERRAERIEDGLNINLNHEDYYTRLVPALEGGDAT